MLIVEPGFYKKGFRFPSGLVVIAGGRWVVEVGGYPYGFIWGYGEEYFEGGGEGFEAEVGGF